MCSICTELLYSPKHMPGCKLSSVSCQSEKSELLSENKKMLHPETQYIGTYKGII